MTNNAHELLALLLAGPLEAAAPAAAKALITACGSLTAVLAARREQLTAVPGVTEAAARLIEVAYAAQCWAAQEEIKDRELLGSSRAVEAYIRTMLRGRSVETAHGLFLDRKNHLIRDIMLSEGTVDHTPLYPREIVRHTLLLEASALILVHNHPSGDPSPSVNDIEITNHIAKALACINVVLHDHLIVGHNRITSLRTLSNWHQISRNRKDNC